MAYEMLTDDVPFTGETLGTVCVAILQGAFDPATQRRPALPPAVDEWFSRAFATEADDRFASARELAHTFRSAVLAQDIEDEDSRDSIQIPRVPTQVGLVRDSDWTQAPEDTQPKRDRDAAETISAPVALPEAIDSAPRAPALPGFGAASIDAPDVDDDLPPPPKRRFRALAFGGVITLGAAVGIFAMRGIDVASSATPPATIEAPVDEPRAIAPGQAPTPSATATPPELEASNDKAVPKQVAKPVAPPPSAQPPTTPAPPTKSTPSREDYGF
jgi:serine/threonine-protein kinase